MSKEILIQSLTLIASTDLSAYQYRAVKLDANGQSALCGAGENAIGIQRDKPSAAGRESSVAALGVALAEYGGAVTAGYNLASDAVGRLVHAADGDAVVGLALEGGASGEVRSVFLGTKTSTGVNNNNSVLSIPIKLSKLANGDILTAFKPGFAGTIKAVAFAVTDPATTADKLATLNLEIGTTNLTGGVVSLTSANCTPLGAVIEGTAVTANNAFGADDTISIEASSVTAFVEGEGVLLITLG
ncbi:MAG: hypothetical protein A4E56_00141 [Pelotomaculum sp. PtaU1.Bin065]|nr:MAG: hypothetical protein A4E56_00141 [Pelotomaculum sp. PtaU1.Bin065]